MKVENVLVTPEIAKRWLEKNINNRKLYQGTCEAYARDMIRGCWLQNNQGIAFDTFGNLIDGQHRLQAVILSNTNQRFFVFTDMPNNTQETVDTGKTRGVGDILTLSMGLENANLKVAMTRSIIHIIYPKHIGKTSVATIRDVMDLYMQEIDLVVKHKRSNSPLKYAPVLGSFAFAAKCFKDEIIEFEDKYFVGDGLEKGNPILTFRNYMLSSHGQHHAITQRIVASRNSLTACMYYILHKPLTKLMNNNAGIEFFDSKQKKTINQVLSIVKAS